MSKLDEIERWAVGSCRDLGLDPGDGGDDFFVIGGTSIGVLRLVAGAEQRYGAGVLSPDDVYKHRVLREIATVVHRNGGAAG
ncbi:acyl carrier protein [Amorphoplanes digitatis]|uniref:Carrier domain-containing protein n=1 Tax=Actinoplanes digitatis TaxID=1868 RepID=A0A7W7HW63_9ACTN|nr:acyl carrier protein [Actinoplanes digitatis]MBB4761834.1 hypothetical protein [Actinoplanes digitatis]BFE70501.1 hypothetical protein GCM10020092_038020 [Actinoplanes digitatis]GID90945.1 hypothetical protein Adi01nite_03570 [Actinoplanes digitatis]